MKRSLMFALILTLAGAASVRVSACDTTCPAGNHWEWNDSKQTTGHCVADPGGPSSTSNSNASANSVASGGNASAVDNAKNTNTSTNTNLNAPVANGGSVKDSGNSSSTATGGTAIAKGGVSQVKDSGNSASNSSVGPISNTNVAKGGQGGQGGAGGQGGTATSQSVSGSSSSSSGSGNTSSYSSSYREAAQTALGISPQPTVSCFKGLGAGAQGLSFGASFSGGSIDSNCAILEAARAGANYAGRRAFCLVWLSNKYVRKAGVTLEDCLVEDPKPVAVVPAPVAVPPQVVVQPQIILPPTPAPVAVPVAHSFVVRPLGVCKLANECKRWIDDGIVALHNNDSAVIGIVGPLESARLINYAVKDRGIDASRISLKVEDVSETEVNLMVEE